MDQLDAMTLCVAVVQDGGFSSAVRRLGVSAPVVTRAVSELVEVLAKHAPPAVPLQALQHQGLRASREVRAFIDLAVERLRH